MATIRKFRGKFNVQIRKQGYPSVSRTFTSLATAKRWASTTEVEFGARSGSDKAKDRLLFG